MVSSVPSGYTTVIDASGSFSSARAEGRDPQAQQHTPAAERSSYIEGTVYV